MDTSKKIGTMATRSESSVDMIEDAFIDYITPKTLNTMKDENRCFFSISLENGITITGENPSEVLNFLIELDSCTFWAAVHYEECGLESLQKSAEKLQKHVTDAAITIKNHLTNKED